MRTRLVATFVCALALAGHAQAQTSNFAGTSLGVGISGGTTEVDTMVNGVNATSAMWDEKSYAAVSAFAEHSIDINPLTVLSFVASIDLNEPKVAQSTRAFAQGAGETFEVKQKNHASLAAELGGLLNDTTLLYGRIAYHHLKGELVGRSGTESETFNGIGYGVGIKLSFAQQLTAALQYEFVDYKKKSYGFAGDTMVITPESNLLSVRVGYKF